MQKQEVQKFIMLPTVDFCFKELMENPKVRKGFVTAHLLDEATGKLYSDKLEIQVLELKKLPENVKTGDDIIAWMKFFSGKSQEDFERMVNTNEYIDEAYNTLLKLSADDIKRMEYEARQKAIRDYNSQMNSERRQGEREGEKRGIAIGEERGVQLTKRIFKLDAQGKSTEEIASLCDITVEKVKEILE